MNHNWKTINSVIRPIKNFKYPENKNSFAYGLNFYKIIWIFMFGCIIGDIMETIWYFAQTGNIESRAGLVYGPFSPVYGFGAVVLTLVLYKLKDSNSLIILSLSFIIGSAFEYFCSWFQEKTLGTISWEYSDFPLNLDGRINLLYSICWGFLGLIFIKHIYPFFSSVIERIPNKFGKWLTWALIIFMLLNIFISFCAVKRLSNRNYNIPPKNSFSVFLDNHFNDERMKNIYPNMTIL